MAIFITCDCGKNLQVPDETAGKQTNCPDCGKLLQITAAAPLMADLAPSPHNSTPQPTTVGLGDVNAAGTGPQTKSDQFSHEAYSPPAPTNESRQKKRVAVGVIFGAFLLLSAITICGIWLVADSRPTNINGPVAAEDYDPGGAPASLGAVPSKEDAAAKLSPITIEEGEDIGRKLCQAMTDGDDRTAQQIVDWSAISDKITRDFNAPAQFKNAFVKAFTKTAASGLNGQIHNFVANGGSYDLLRVRIKEGQTFVLIRMVLPDAGGFNYHELPLKRYANGQIRATDIYVYASGEMLSQTTRRLYALSLPSVSRSALEKLFGSKDDFTKHQRDMLALINAARTGDAAGGYSAYHRLPVKLQREKSLMIIYIQVAMALEEKKYLDAIDAFARAHPNDPSLALLGIDGYYLRKQYDKAHTEIDKLDNALGGDPYLNTVRCGLLIEQGDLVEARTVALQTVEDLPGQTDGMWSLLLISVTEEKYDECVKWLDKIAMIDQIDLDFFQRDDTFKDFGNSEQFKAWKSTQR